MVGDRLRSVDIGHPDTVTDAGRSRVTIAFLAPSGQPPSGLSAIAGPIGNSRRLSGTCGCRNARARVDVLVQPEDVVGVVATLDLDEAVPGRARIRLVDPRRPVLGQEVDIGAGLLARGQRPDEVIDPALAD